MQYIVFFDKRFLRQSINELKSIADGIRILKYLSDSIIIADAVEKIDAKAVHDSTFIYKAEELLGEVSVSAGYSDLAEKLKEMQSEKGYASSKIEVLREAAIDQRNAKSIEVEIGTLMEKLGAAISMSSPAVIFHVILCKDAAYVSAANPKDSYGATLDYFRHSNLEKGMMEKKINRAEFKLHEAVLNFDIDLSLVKSVLDIGAAPGGWSRYMLDHGIRVVAIDTGSMNYAAMPKGKTMAVLAGKDSKVAQNGIDVYPILQIPDNIKNYDFVHLADRFENIRLSTLVDLGPFDMVCIDVNLPSTESAIMAAVCAEALKNSGKLLLTLKMTDPNIEQNINKSAEILSGKYGSIKVKKLPHDRKELTLFAIKI
ncbi:hypothetical protein M1373_00060 [Candidatus Marsarchaeota archaeon]|nr:hypothetical protein [Candidatus Marsarchaeota archaeon]MCL5404509.1 hypothetical protein [Candidatus Marsarchaeota archaeon]